MQRYDIRTYEEDGRLRSIEVPWADAQHHPTSKVAKFVALYGSAYALLPLPFVLFLARAGRIEPLIAWSAVAAICAWCIWYCLKNRYPTEYPCRMVLYVNGRAEFTTAPGADGKTRPLALNAADIRSIEYGLTKQWTTLDTKRYVVKEWEGEWYDVFALLTNGRRVLLARNTWDRDYNHELALLLGDAIREVQDMLKPPPGNPHAGAAKQAQRERRRVD